ncbi:MAG TPA: hypothetical protein VJZ51_06360 [Bacilli bacterium]|nr:hypothetical protein [Bacilli bacterium]
MELCSIAYYKQDRELVLIQQVYVVKQEYRIAADSYVIYYIKKNAIRPDEVIELILTREQKETLVLIGAENEETTNIE